VTYNASASAVTIAPEAVGMVVAGSIAWGIVYLAIFVSSIVLFVKNNVLVAGHKFYGFAVATIVLMALPFPPANLVGFIMACYGIHQMRKIPA
jgi:hypothetical protein